MTPKFDKVHHQFKYNGLHFSREDLKEVAYSLVKEGEPYEQITGDFLIDWLSDKDPLDPNKAFVVHLHTGLQYNRNANSTRYAWAVHDGDIASNFDSAGVPVPASAFLFGSALLGLIVTRRKANP